MLIILLLAVLLFGKRLPEVARSIGKSLAEFQRGVQSIQQELQATLREKPRLPLQLRRLPAPAGPTQKTKKKPWLRSSSRPPCHNPQQKLPKQNTCPKRQPLHNKCFLTTEGMKRNRLVRYFTGHRTPTTHSR